MTGQRTPEQMQAVKRGRIAATLKREQREAAEAQDQALGGRLKAKMKAKSARLDEVPPFCYLTDGKTPEEAVANAAQHFNITIIEALAMVWTLRRATHTAFSEPALCVGIGRAKKSTQQPSTHAEAETISAVFPVNTTPTRKGNDLPTTAPTNNRSTHQGTAA